MTKETSIVLHISVAKFYCFEGWTFEYNRNKPFGPWPCRKDMEPRARAGDTFYSMFGRFSALSDEEQDEFLLK